MKGIDKKGKTFIGYVIIVFCLVIIGAAVMFVLGQKGKESDPETFCLDNVSKHTIVLLDKTDSFSINQQKFILKYIAGVKDRLEAFEKFSIFILTEDNYMGLEPLFSRCNPGTGEDANQLYQNPEKIQMRFNQFFEKPLQENLSVALSSSTSSKTPLFEMIRELTFREDFGNGTERRLIIISDMMHHTRHYSHYKQAMDFERFAGLSYSDEVKAHLNSAAVEIVYLRRSALEYRQGKRHISFWKDYFNFMGARVALIRNVK